MSTPANLEHESPPRERRKYLILSICCLSLLMVSLDVTILNVALPTLQHQLHASISGAQWTIDAYLVVLASLLTLAGSTADRVGRRRVFQIGLVVFTVGSLLCSVAPTLGWLIAFRMLQAVGGSMLNPVAMSIITNVFTDPKERAKAIGAWSGTLGISMAGGPIIGGILVDTIGWRSIFWMNIPIGIAAVVLTGLFVPESKAHRARRADPAGQLLLVAFLAFLIYSVIEAPSLGWGSAETLVLFAVALVSLALFVGYERARRDPMMDLRFFRSPPFAAASVVAVCAFMALGGFLFLNTLYLQDVRGFSAIRAGAYLLPMAVAMFVFGPLSGRLVANKGPRPSLVIGALSLLVASVLFATSEASSIASARLLIGYALIGVGLGMLNAAITNTAVEGMPRSQAGVASGITSTSRQIGQSLGVAVIGSVIATHLARVRAGAAFNAADHDSWWIIAAVGAAILVMAATATGSWGTGRATRNAERMAEEDLAVGRVG